MMISDSLSQHEEKAQKMRVTLFIILAFNSIVLKNRSITAECYEKRLYHLHQV